MSVLRQLAVPCWLLIAAVWPLHAAEKINESPDDTRTFSIRARLKVEGTIQTAGIDGKSSSLKTAVDGKLTYLERRLPPGGREAEALRAMRAYQLAEAEITVGDRKTINRLDKNAQQIVAEGRREGVRVYSLAGPMTYENVELLRTPGDSLALLGLLPLQEIDSTSTWTPAAWVLPCLAGVEAVSEQSLTCNVEKLDSQFAIITFEGKLAGAVHGAVTKISVSGKVAFDRANKHIRQAVVEQEEERAIGAVSPGMKVKATIQVDRAPVSGSNAFSDTALSRVPINTEPQQLALWFDAPWGLRFAYDRHWHVFHQKENVAVLRLMDAGSLVAQCNVSQMPMLAAGAVTSMNQFQDDIRTSLGAAVKGFSEAAQTKTSSGITLYRVVATGEAQKVPMHWLYYLCISPDGRQTAFVFAVESRLVEQLAQRDREMVESVLFVSGKPAGK